MSGCLTSDVAHRHSVAGDHLDDAGRHHLLGELEEAKRRQRRLLGRLEDLDVARGERRSELPDDHHQRVVPRRDPRHDAERLTADDRRVALDVLRGGLPLEVARGAGEEAEVVDGERDLVDGDRRRLADVLGLELPQLFGVLLHDVREREQELHPVLRRLRLPLVPCRRARRRPHARRRRPSTLGTSAMTSPVAGLSTSIVWPSSGIDPLAADEVLVLRHRHRHLTTSSRVSRSPIINRRRSPTRAASARTGRSPCGRRSRTGPRASSRRRGA